MHGSSRLHYDAVLKRLLSDVSRPITSEADFREVQLASHIYDVWTDRGVCEEKLAERFINGHLDTLTDYRRAANVNSPTDDIIDTDGDLCGQIVVRQASDLSYSEFVCQYMAPNIPVVIEAATEGWTAARDWVLPNGGINIDFLDSHFGTSSVTAVDTSRQAVGCSGSWSGSLSHYLAWWRARVAADLDVDAVLIESRQGSQSERRKTTGPDSSAERRSSLTDKNQSLLRGASNVSGLAHIVGSSTLSKDDLIGPDAVLYLKDWHFHQAYPDYNAYDTPPWFCDDWLSRFYNFRQAADGQPHTVDSSPVVSWQQGAEMSQDAHQPWELPENALAHGDYRFVYLGVKGTWTALHADVLRSYSWSVNVAGTKRWQLLPPQYTHLLYDVFGREMAPCFGADDEDDRFPNLQQARKHVVEVVQPPGSAIFVPSGWHHTVLNIEDTLSINQNWVNGFNLHWGWELLQREHEGASAAISDCRSYNSKDEFEILVQRNMLANAGLNFEGILDLICTIASLELKRLRCVGRGNGSPDAAVADTDAVSPSIGNLQDVSLLQHRFNLKRIEYILLDLQKHHKAIHESDTHEFGGLLMLHCIREALQ